MERQKKIPRHHHKSNPSAIPVVLYKATMMNTAASVLFRRTVLRPAAVSRSIGSVAARGSSATSSYRWSLSSAPRVAPSSVRSFSAASDALVTMLQREHDEEQANQTLDMPEELTKLKKQIETRWKLVDDGAMTKLYKTVGAALKVQISFHCQDTVSEYEGDDEDDEEESTEEPDNGVRFTVTATKAGKSVVWNCVSRDAAITIQGVGLTNEDVDLVQKTSGISENLYQGPDFTELAEDLQDAFHEYLDEELGADSDLSAFIAMYTDYKEQCQYVQFLSDVQSIVKA